jgi:hypothetical protein
MRLPVYDTTGNTQYYQQQDSRKNHLPFRRLRRLLYFLPDNSHRTDKNQLLFHFSTAQNVQNNSSTMSHFFLAACLQTKSMRQTKKPLVHIHP